MELKRLHILPQSARDCDDPEYNQFSTSWPMIQGVLVAGSYPGVAFIRSGSKLRKIHTIVLPNSLASLHPSSTLRRQVQTNKHTEYLQKFYNSEEPNIECLIYQELSKIDEGLTVSAFKVQQEEFKTSLVENCFCCDSFGCDAVFGSNQNAEIHF